MSPILTSKALVLGTGIAGLSTALKFADRGFDVLLVCKGDPAEGSTRYAQGGIASVWSKDDTVEEHIQDTLTAGAGLCNENIVDLCVREGPARVRELIELGVQFTRITPAESAEASPETGTDGAETFSLHREGGHGQRRILHADDLTGWAIEKALLKKVDEHPCIRLLDHHVAIDLITEGKARKRNTPGRCLGAYALNEKTGEVLTLSAGVTVLATGGAGKAYLYTSNPDTATGDGIAMAYRAGAQVSNMEFMQFHPTCLYHPTARTFLISEALRGEGAVLKTLAGEEFMGKYHMLGSLAPRDVVARAIDMEMKRTGDKHVLLDATHIPAEELKRKFPHIHETCRFYGIDMTVELIPVVPAAHYTCGGVRADENGQSSVAGLYAVGEAACTGLHGANRLASNSLLEAVVFAHRVAEHGGKQLTAQQESGTPGPDQGLAKPLPQWDTGHAVEIEEQIDIAANWLEIRHLMWNYVGIVRSNRRLERAKRRLELLRSEVNAYYWDYLLTRDLIELRNLLTVAELIVQCAILRKESRGLHYTVDYPAKDERSFKHDTVV
ncbi:MAG: L-aspartate oxidase [Bdellovibrionales bacterium GWB1_55_8]|nr:MAG: L-aspartate oxidase [Bdellovibrionales bacterium GWB1_55_8]